MSRKARLKRRWAKFWMQYAGNGLLGRAATNLAVKVVPPYYGCVSLANLSAKGYISNSATIYHDCLSLGRNCFIGDRVTIYKNAKGGAVKLGDAVHLHNDNTIQTGQGGKVVIGSHTHIQPRCQISSYMQSINIGSGVEIAPNCAFYSYNHSIEPNIPIREQPLISRGDITIGNDVWLGYGYGVVVLDGVTIGDGAVVGASSVVTSDIPSNAIAVGSPARVVDHRDK